MLFIPITLNKPLNLSAFILSLLCPLLLFSNVLIHEDFSSDLKIEFTDMIWNSLDSELTPLAKVNSWDFDASLPLPQDKNIDFGEAFLGIFDQTTYDLYDDDGDFGNSIISLNTDKYADGLNFLSFKLEAGITIKVSGQNPLIIRVIDDVLIAGRIDCSGEDGEDIVNDVSQVASGGRGFCGGKNGGDGGSSTQSPLSGEDTSLLVTGGVGGGSPGANGGVGGGGGGGLSLSGSLSSPGEDPNSIGIGDGALGGLSSSADPGFEILEGGAGGGGGSYVVGGNGGGGGAGGGFIFITAGGVVHIESTGEVLANGGNGGGGGAYNSGGGGGGAGGSILIFSGEEIINDKTNGITAIAGIGGVTGNVIQGGSNGGAGVVGRFWGTDSDGSLSGSGTENPGIFLMDSGIINSQVGDYSLILGIYDTENLKPVLESLNLNSNLPAGSSLDVFVATNEKESFEAVNWLDSSSLIGVKLDRYIKFKIMISNNNESDPVKLKSLSANFSIGNLTDFDFISVCGSVIGLKTNFLSLSFSFLLLIFPFLILILFRFPFLTSMFKPY